MHEETHAADHKNDELVDPDVADAIRDLLEQAERDSQPPPPRTDHQ